MQNWQLYLIQSVYSNSTQRFWCKGKYSIDMKQLITYLLVFRTKYRNDLLNEIAHFMTHASLINGW